MPIVKVPVVHKFGIISHAHRLQLHKRLVQQNHPAAVKTLASKSDLEVSDAFIKEYNDAVSFPEKERLQHKAEKILERIKRKLGLRDGGTGKHVDLPSAWTDLSLLAQCKGQLQEENLKLLTNSLDQAPLDTSHIPVLFYLAESALYTLRTELVSLPYLTAGEIQLLLMARLVFLHLYYHYMTGHLTDYKDLAAHLVTYLDGFEESQEAYSEYPNGLLCVHFVCNVGQIIVGGESAGDSEPESHVDEQLSTCSAAVSSTVHELTPSLWHALDVWRCAVQLSGGLESALDALASCGGRLASSSWVDAVCALEVLADAAKANLRVLSVLQDIARGFSQLGTSATPSGRQQAGDGSVMSVAGRYHQDTAKSLTADRYRADGAGETQDETGGLPTVGHPTAGDETPASATPKTQMSKTSAAQKYTSTSHSNQRGLHGWNWEIAVAYTETMSDICLHASTSVIQKRALIGRNRDADLVHKTSAIPTCPMNSAGLLDLAFFHTVDEGLSDWSWRVRYTALQGLISVCRCMSDNPLKDGLRTVAWNALMKVNALERDTRVLEALKVLPIDATLEKLLDSRLVIQPSTIAARIASGLSELYLPPLPAVTSLPMQKQKSPKMTAKKCTAEPNLSHQLPKTDSRKTTLVTNRSANAPLPSYEVRTSEHLMRIVADQWKKELEDIAAVENELRTC